MMDADRNPSPWHRGEREVHRRLGVSEEIEAIGGHNIRPFMPDQHRLFFAQLPFMLVGSVDRTGRPWASLLSGRPGFVQSPDPRLLHVAALPAPGDPLVEALVPGARVGMLGIELPTRRRNRSTGASWRSTIRASPSPLSRALETARNISVPGITLDPDPGAGGSSRSRDCRPPRAI
jgi:predicted pyridoxine 5'-phosphate oxidase superfamily flavin-nucleotide-binding protein